MSIMIDGRWMCLVDGILTAEECARFIEELDKRSQSPRKDYTPARDIYNQLKTKIRV